MRVSAPEGNIVFDDTHPAGAASEKAIANSGARRKSHNVGHGRLGSQNSSARWSYLRGPCYTQIVYWLLTPVAAVSTTLWAGISEVIDGRVAQLAEQLTLNQ